MLWFRQWPFELFQVAPLLTCLNSDTNLCKGWRRKVRKNKRLKPSKHRLSWVKSGCKPQAQPIENRDINQVKSARVLACDCSLALEVGLGLGQWHLLLSLLQEQGVEICRSWTRCLSKAVPPVFCICSRTSRSSLEMLYLSFILIAISKGTTSLMSVSLSWLLTVLGFAPEKSFPDILGSWCSAELLATKTEKQITIDANITALINTLPTILISALECMLEQPHLGRLRLEHPVLWWFYIID